MLHCAVGRLVIALIPAWLGWGGAAAAAVGIAKTLFAASVVMAVLTCIMGWVCKGWPTHGFRI